MNGVVQIRIVERTLRAVHGAAYAVILVLLAATTDAAPTPPWMIADAPYRAAIKLAAAPTVAEAGIEINLQEFGQTRPDLADIVLTDGTGTPQPLTKIGSRPGGRIVLLAQKLQPNTPYFLYFGGDKLRGSPEWTPKTSLLMETRPAPPDLSFDSLQSVKTAWSQSPEAPGAGFVSQIYHGGNPFGPNINFLTRYTGYLRLPQAREITFYTLSSDCSFVVVNDQFQFGWPGQHSPATSPQNVSKKAVQCPEGLVKIEYYAAKGDILPDQRLEAGMVLGWQTETGFQAIPPEVWLHPGTSQVGPIQSADGAPLPIVRTSVESFVAYANQWLYEIRFDLRPPNAIKGWSATWDFEDGATVTGTSGTRVLTGKETQIVHCKLTRDDVTIDEQFRILVPDRLQRASINEPNDVRRYIGMLIAETDSKLKPDAVRARLVLLNECGTDQDVAKLAESWPEQNQSDALWLPVRLATIRAHAQLDPAQAKQEFMSLLQFLQPGTQKIYTAELVTAEMDLLVFNLRDPEAFGRLDQLAFINPDSALNRTVKIRIGDLHRLLGHYKEAAAQYQTLGAKTKDLALPVKDSAASITIRELIERGFAKDAQAKLLEWELRRPMVKFDSDYLLLRARTLMCFGRWSEALAELESFQKVQPESPFQMDAQFYLARILYEKGSKDEARKLWEAFAKDYPKHELTPQAKEWAKKP